MPSFIDRLSRKKIVDFGDTKLKRALTLLDLTMLGVGSTIGVGFYVLVGQVAKTFAGPAVIISFLIAGVASVFAGLCYAEFGARVPKAGSAYIYSYVCVGECVAFIIGWNLVLEYIIGASSVARGFSGYIDALANKKMSDSLTEALPMNVDFLSPYPDFLSLGLILFVSVLLAVGIKESSTFNNVFSIVNLIIVIYVIIAAATKVDVHNWNLSYNETQILCGNTSDWGQGGFSPYGFSGIMGGAATCFFGFVGFDCIATTGEEAINPSRNIPLSISVSLLIIFLAYFGMSTTITLALPYCMQDEDAALVQFFEMKDMEVSKWIVSIGALFGFSASLIGVLLPLPRIIYAMANDGVIFRILARVNKRFQTPFIATLFTGTIAGGIAMIFDLASLVEMMSIGTLMAYTIVAVSVMLLRYVPDEDEDSSSLMESSRSNTLPDYSFKEIWRHLFNLDGLKDPTYLSGTIANYATLTFCILIAILGILLTVLGDELSQGDPATIADVSVISFLVIVNMIIIWRQPESKRDLTFKVPFVPWMPALSAIINVYLMFNLQPETWIRFAVWMAIGMPIYFFYGMRHSTEELRYKKGGLGIDNPAGPQSQREFIIPTINVQLATPLNSAPGTPKTIHNIKKEQRPISPLAKVEAKTVMSAVTSNVDVKAESESDVQEVLESLDKIVSPSAPVIEAEECALDASKDEDSPKHTDVQSRELPPIPPVEDKTSNSDQSDIIEVSSSISSDSKYETLLNVQPDEEPKDIAEDDTDTLARKSTDDPPYETIDAVKGQIMEIETQSDDRPKPPLALLSEIVQKVPKADAEDGSKSEALYATVDKSLKKKPEPLDFSQSDLSDSRRSSMKSSSSAPQMPYSPSTPIPMTAFAPRSSVPTTPISSRRHPTKLLKRNSSFDEIPPSSLDSPHARRVDKFFIIPVQEPNISDSESGSPQPSPSPTIHSESRAVEGQEVLMSELKKKFNKLYESEREKYEEGSPKEGHMFYVGSDDSLENMNMNSSSDLPSPTNTREFKRVTTKENFSLGEGLDTIRERGESKIYAEDSQTEIANTSREASAAMSTKTVPPTVEEERTHRTENFATDNSAKDISDTKEDVQIKSSQNAHAELSQGAQTEMNHVTQAIESKTVQAESSHQDVQIEASEDAQAKASKSAQIETIQDVEAETKQAQVETSKDTEASSTSESATPTSDHVKKLRSLFGS